MSESKYDFKKQLLGYERQATSKIIEAGECRTQGRHGAAVQDCQEAIELLAKCVFLLRGRPYPRDHEIPEKEFLSVITGLPPEAEYLNLPRLYLLHLFWAAFYSNAKYGLETLAVPAQDLFQHGESDLAISHAREWQGAFNRLKTMLQGN